MNPIQSITSRKGRALQAVSYLMRHGASSRKEISEKLCVTASTLTKISKELIQIGLIYEKGVRDSRTVGRKELDIDIVDDSCFAFGFDVANRYLRVTLLNARLELVAMKEWRYPLLTHDILEKGIAYLRELMNEYPRDRILGLGLLGQGYVYNDQFMSLSIHNIREILEANIDVDIYCMNNIRGLAVAQTFLCEEDCNFFMLHYGPGVSTVMVQDGSIVSGSHNKSGEIGHAVWDLNSSEICKVCGKKGCVESILNFERVAKQADPSYDAIYTDYELLSKVYNKDGGKALDEALVTLAKIVNLLLSFCDPQKILLCGEIFTNPVFFRRFSQLLLELDPDLSLDSISLVENYSEKRWKSSAMVVMNEYFGNASLQSS